MEGGSLQSSMELWDDACSKDDVRQTFVLPAVRRMVAWLRPTTLFDLGAKTGYALSFLLCSSREALRDCRMVAVDQDRAAVAYMTQRFRRTTIEVLQATISALNPQLIHQGRDDRTLYLLLYTALELDDEELRTFFASVRNGGHIVVVVPDSAIDAFAAGHLEPFMNGESVHLEKVDKFDGLPYPFIARRLEAWLPWALNKGHCLRRMESYRALHGHMHYLLHFESGA